MFCPEADLSKGMIAENRHVVFSWKLSDEKTSDVLLEQMLERTHNLWKEYKYNPRNIR